MVNWKKAVIEHRAVLHDKHRKRYNRTKKK